MSEPMPATAESIAIGPVARSGARPLCSVCERAGAVVFLSAAKVAAELDARERFFSRRLRRRFSRDQLRDLTSVVLGTGAAILRCMRCGLLIRDATPADEVFRDDPYTDEVLETLHETHLQAFREKEDDYRSLLLSHARVIEVGSYVGGFLCAAAEWGWSAIGTDIGRDPVRFCRGLGLDARRGSLHDVEVGEDSFDAVFVFNCFEQLADPRELLAASHRLLRHAGLLVIRIPDAGFYIQNRHELEAGEDDSILGVLAYNGLLGWPHRFGYDAVTLRHLVEPTGFTFRGCLRRPAVRPLRDALHAWAQEEETAATAGSNHGWIEVLFRKL
jgi:SAM-dependent methyltransferase